MKQSDSRKTKDAQRQTGRGIVNPDALAGLKRRAEDLGLILHARAKSAAKRVQGKSGRGK
jgi:hypothetical protein